MELTKDAKKLLSLLYKKYLKKREEGLPKSKACVLGSSHIIHESLCPDWIFEDVVCACRELSHAHLLECRWGNNIPVWTSITDDGISYMENRFKNVFLDTSGIFSKLIELIKLIPR